MKREDFLARLVDALEHVGIPYMVTGSFASSAHGRPRSTEDIDVVIAPTEDQLRAFIALFPSNAYYADEQDALEALQYGSQFNIIDFASSWKADLIIRKEREFSRHEFHRRELHSIQDLRIFVTTAEDVLIAKLEWAQLGGSDRQLEDVAGIIERQGVDLDRGYVERWVAELGLNEQWQKALGKAGR